MSNDVVVKEKPSSMHNIMQVALEKGATIEQMKEMMAMQERMDKNAAIMAYNSAMSEFSANIPKIAKDTKVKFETNKGVTEYSHASLGNVVSTIAGELSKYGLSHRWRTQQLDGGAIKVTCILTHAMGHSEETSLQSSPDSSGGKNNIQAIGSTVTYLERYTLLAATGCSTEDDDGMSSETREGITDDQAAFIGDLVESAGKKDAFCRFYNIESIDELQKRDYQEAVKMLEAKIRKLSK